MSVPTTTKWALMIALAAFAARGDDGAGPELVVAPGARLWLEGESTLHPYRSTAATFETRVRINPSATTTDVGRLVRSGDVAGLAIRFPVTALRSGEAALDKNLRNALKASEHPAITFEMQRYRVSAAAAGGEAFELDLEGALSLAGVERPVSLHATATPTSAGLRILGGTTVKMTDFGVTPPVLMMGMLKTADEVDVKFDLELRLRGGANPLG